MWDWVSPLAHPRSFWRVVDRIMRDPIFTGIFALVMLAGMVHTVIETDMTERKTWDEWEGGTTKVSEGGGRDRLGCNEVAKVVFEEDFGDQVLAPADALIHR